MTITIEESMRQMLLRILDAHYAEPDEPSHRAVWIDLTLDHVGDSADVELARSGVWRGTLAEWLEAGRGLVRRLPVGRVELVDRQPHHTLGAWGWFVAKECGYPYDLPLGWFKGMQGWVDCNTIALALDDASRRAIAWARGTTEEGKETA